MIVARLEKKTASDGKPYLSGRTVVDVPKGTLVVLKKSDRQEGEYEVWELGERKVNTKTAGFLF